MTIIVFTDIFLMVAKADMRAKLPRLASAFGTSILDLSRFVRNVRIIESQIKKEMLKT